MCETQNPHGSEEDYTQYILGTLQSQEDALDWFQEMMSKDYGLFKLDTGAQDNVLPAYVFKMLVHNPGFLKNTEIKITNYGGAELKVLGVCILTVLFENKNFDIEFVVVETDNKFVNS